MNAANPARGALRVCELRSPRDKAVRPDYGMGLGARRRDTFAVTRP
jgi:hypothetical protein